MSQDIIETLRQKYGDSTKESRDAVEDAFDGIENLISCAMTWAAHHKILGVPEDLQVAFATAVDIGYRIGKK